MRMRGTVFVGLSGGVDSSVAAQLLKKQGYKLVGVFIKIWQPEFTECAWPEDRRSAMRVTAHLRIPFLTLDLSREYKRDVLRYMIAEYKRGRTPNPDVACNQDIKFGAFLRWALKRGADYIATGHYARVKDDKGNFELHQGLDKNKDQSYFLWTLSQDELARTLFPIGHLQKPQVRAIARRMELPTAERLDSQGLCFVGELNLRDFLRNYLPLKAGDVLDEKGRIIGRHKGAVSYTLGQRHGFAIGKANKDTGPRYVTAIDVRENTLTVSEGPAHSVHARTDVELEDIHWIGGVPRGGLMARFRYRQPLMPVTVNGKGVTFVEPVLAPRGQSLVLYRGSECVGGAIIK